MAADQLLFSYGTLQHPEVQLDMFGRVLDSEDDVLPGSPSTTPRSRIAVVDASVSRSCGRRATRCDKVVGKVLWVTEDELDASDEYEVALYRRASVVLASGRTAWVYVAS